MGFELGHCQQVLQLNARWTHNNMHEAACICVSIFGIYPFFICIDLSHLILPVIAICDGNLWVWPYQSSKRPIIYWVFFRFVLWVCKPLEIVLLKSYTTRTGEEVVKSLPATVGKSCYIISLVFKDPFNLSHSVHHVGLSLLLALLVKIKVLFLIFHSSPHC